MAQGFKRLTPRGRPGTVGQLPVVYGRDDEPSFKRGASRTQLVTIRPRKRAKAAAARGVASGDGPAGGAGAPQRPSRAFWAGC